MFSTKKNWGKKKMFRHPAKSCLPKFFNLRFYALLDRTHLKLTWDADFRESGHLSFTLYGFYYYGQPMSIAQV